MNLNMRQNNLKLEKQLPQIDASKKVYISIEVKRELPYNNIDASRKQCSPGDMLSSSAWKTY